MPMPYLLLQTLIVPAIAVKGACFTSSIPYPWKGHPLLHGGHPRLRHGDQGYE